MKLPSISERAISFSGAGYVQGSFFSDFLMVVVNRMESLIWQVISFPFIDLNRVSDLA